ncbi:MAG: hypothetical protein JKP98_23895 [Rhodobacteraceae bacterium]|nr:hypothetical protein [Paracoccaceae bacterium]
MRITETIPVRAIAVALSLALPGARLRRAGWATIWRISGNAPARGQCLEALCL